METTAKMMQFMEMKVKMKMMMTKTTMTMMMTAKMTMIMVPKINDNSKCRVNIEKNDETLYF
jgi:hypothetical protein